MRAVSAADWRRKLEAQRQTRRSRGCQRGPFAMRRRDIRGRRKQAQRERPDASNKPAADIRRAHNQKQEQAGDQQQQNRLADAGEERPDAVSCAHQNQWEHESEASLSSAPKEHQSEYTAYG